MPIATAPHPDSFTSFPPYEYASLLDKPIYGDWRDELAQTGWTVIKGAVPRERALEYRDKFFQWLEDFPWGFKRDDPSTWKNEHLPPHIKGGMFYSHGIAHEDFVSPPLLSKSSPRVDI